jgi:3-hydroxyisobutyrate dehydrogenase-like beta-hydroxyacid dehydrogenase
MALDLLLRQGRRAEVIRPKEPSPCARSAKSRCGSVNLALSNARALGLSLPNTATAQQLFNTCVAHAGSKWDDSSLARALEIMSNHEIGGK